MPKGQLYLLEIGMCGGRASPCMGLLTGTLTGMVSPLQMSKKQLKPSP